MPKPGAQGVNEAMIPHRKTSCALVALVGLLVVGIATLLCFQGKGPRRCLLAGPEPSPEPKEAEPHRQRSWPLESLPGLSFDEALTLLGNEVESTRQFMTSFRYKPLKTSKKYVVRKAVPATFTTFSSIRESPSRRSLRS